MVMGWGWEGKQESSYFKKASLGSCGVVGKDGVSGLKARPGGY